MHGDVLMHLEHAEHLGQPADAVVLQIQGKGAADPDLLAAKGEDTRERHFPADAVEEEVAVQRDRQTVLGARSRRCAIELESQGGIRRRLHRLVEIAVAPVVARHQSLDRSSHPAVYPLEARRSFELPGYRRSRPGEVAHGGVTIEAETALAHTAAGDRALLGAGGARDCREPEEPEESEPEKESSHSSSDSASAPSSPYFRTLARRVDRAIPRMWAARRLFPRV